MNDFFTLKKNLKKDFTNLKKIKMAVLGDTATQLLSQAIRGTGYDFSYDFEIWESDFNQIERQVFDPGSDLYHFEAELLVIFQSTHKLLGKYNKLNPGEAVTFAQNQLDSIKQLYNTVTERANTKIIFYNYPEIDDSVFGNYSNKVQHSFLFQLRKLNYELMLFACEASNLFLCDLSSIQNRIGRNQFFKGSIYVNTEMVINLDALPLVSKQTVDLVAAIYGKFKKCLILDLDHTMWGGVIGDDGMENIEIGSLGIGKAFSEFQYWAKKLKDRGVILAVCSKNTESIAKEPFEKHPEMVLKLEDIAVFKANWDNKADNIRAIQEILNIGFDSMVFVDDNPVERSIVRENLPEVCVPEMPEDPADYLEYLYSLNLFETVSFSNEDSERTKLYQTEAKRQSTQKIYTNEGDFLKSLEMSSEVEPFNKFNTPRVAQLSQRSNQFNLRTIRYTEKEIESVANSDQNFTFAFSLKDKFGDNGIICVVILKEEDKDTLFIDTWLMSCRVLKRGMETFTLNTLVELAKEKGYTALKGEHIPTRKNVIVENHYADLGFEQREHFWELSVKDYEYKNCYINKENN